MMTEGIEAVKRTLEARRRLHETSAPGPSLCARMQPLAGSFNDRHALKCSEPRSNCIASNACATCRGPYDIPQVSVSANLATILMMAMELPAQFTPAPINVDGVMDAAWSQRNSGEHRERIRPRDDRARRLPHHWHVRAMWDGALLYLLVSVDDPHVTSQGRRGVLDRPLQRQGREVPGRRRHDDRHRAARSVHRQPSAEHPLRQRVVALPQGVRLGAANRRAGIQRGDRLVSRRARARQWLEVRIRFRHQ